MATAEANQRYDRQIRVWGKEAQGRLVSAKVLIAGLSAVNVEVAKNLALAGVNITVQDHSAVSALDFGVNFLLEADSLGSNRAAACLSFLQALNPYSEMSAISQPLRLLPDELIASFDVIVYCGWDEEEAVRLNEALRSKQKAWRANSSSSGSRGDSEAMSTAATFWSMSFGHESLFFSDFGTAFLYLPDPSASATASSSASHAPSRSLKCLESHSPFSSTLQISLAHWSDNARQSQKLFPLSKTYLKALLLLRALRKQREGGETGAAGMRDLLEVVYGEERSSGLSPGALLTEEELGKLSLLHQAVSPMAVSVMGSMLAQEVVKAITHVGVPSNGVFVFDNLSMVVKSMPSPKE